MVPLWAVLVVWWCICCMYAYGVVVEQPNTVAHDYGDAVEWAGAERVELRTGELGDARDKYMKITLRNVEADLEHAGSGAVPPARRWRPTAPTPTPPTDAVTAVSFRCDLLLLLLLLLLRVREWRSSSSSLESGGSDPRPTEISLRP